MPYQIHYGSSAFAVPGDVADHFLRLADAVQLRVLLYLLRHEGAAPAQIAAFLHITEEQAEEALAFWVQADVLRTDQAEAGKFPFAPPAPALQETPAVPAVQQSSREVKLDPTEIADALGHSQTLRDLFSHSEKILGKPLSHMEQRSLLWLHQYIGMPGEVLLMLLRYCVSIGKYSASYLEAIAVRWAEQDIMTMPQAEEAITQMQQSHDYTARLRRMFEMKRSPTTQQKKYIDAWRAAGYSMELLQYAYELTIENIEKLNFKYINTILTGWAEQGITTPEQAKQRDSAHRSGKRRKPALTAEEAAEMDEYLSLVNRFKEDKA